MTYDPVETQTLAEELQSRAAAASLYSTLYGVAIGAFLMGPWFISVQWILFSVLGGLLGGAIGFRLGQTRAVSLRAQAQSLLCQLKIEENTRKQRQSPNRGPQSLPDEDREEHPEVATHHRA
jgi:hypothetical protein